MKLAAWLPAFAFLAVPITAMAEEAASQEVPAALAGLSFERQETVQWYVVFGLESEGLWAPRLIGIIGKKRLDERIVSAAKMLKPGDLFFEDHQFMKKRFKFLGIVDKEVRNPVTGLTTKARVAEFEDLKHNKKGFKYESIKGLPENEIASHAYCDRTAVLGIKVAGKDWPVEFKIEEQANFALPPDGPNKNFFLKEVSEEKVVVEYKDQAGAVREATIAKNVKDPAEVLENVSYLRDESVQWYVKFGLEHEGQWAPKLLALGTGIPRFAEPMVSATLMIKTGDIFFEKAPMKGRFKFNGFATREVMNRKTNAMEKVHVAAFEDLKPNKKGLKYESQSGLPDAEIASHAYYDRTAVLGIKVPGKDKLVEIKVEELTNFALPPDAPDKAFFLKEVDPGKVVVEYKDQTGADRIVTIVKEAGKDAEPPTYHAIVIPKNAEAMAALTRIEKVVVTPKGVKDMDLSDAARQLNKPGEDPAVMNLVIRKPRRGGGLDETPAEPDKVRKASLPEIPLSFAAAIDILCTQAGYQWEIEVEEQVPVLVLKPAEK